MDSYEATRIVFSKVQSLDPENGSKIMGYILIQDHGDKEMIRLALGPESLLHQLIVKAKTHLGLVSCSSPVPATAPPSPAGFSPFSRVARPSSLSIPASGSRFAGGFDFGGVSSPASSGGWPVSGFSDHRSPMSPNGSLSYANVVNGSVGSGSVSGSCLSPKTFSNYGAGGNSSGDEYNLSFLNDQKGDDFIDYGGESQSHRRSYSVPGVFFGSPPEDPSGGGFGWKPCLYFARGFCKNGSACRFLHGGDGDGDAVGAPEQCHEHLMRSKSAAFAAAAQQQKLAAASQFIAGVGAATFPYTKCVNFLQQENENQRSAAAALMIGDELMKFGRCRPERSDFPAMGLNNPGSRQIYLTFPADSTFREEDVSNYFSIYGPVHDVRIPYQQKRMFGFVTFVYPETVKLILAKGNPHFVCDSRVLVKPYKEKGKIIDKKMQHMDRGDYMGCSSPTGDPYELNLGAKMFYNTQEMLLKRKLEEQADLQQAIELQERRLMNLQLFDLKNHHRHHQNFHQGLAVGSPINSPTISHNPNNGSQVRVPSPDDMKPKSPEENGGSPVGVAEEETNNGGCNGNGKEEEEKSSNEECDPHESLEHILPDNLFASPKKSGGDNLTAFSSSGDDTSSTTTSALNMAPLKSCFLQIPRFSSGHGTIGL